MSSELEALMLPKLQALGFRDMRQLLANLDAVPRADMDEITNLVEGYFEEGDRTADAVRRLVAENESMFQDLHAARTELKDYYGALKVWRRRTYEAEDTLDALTVLRSIDSYKDTDGVVLWWRSKHEPPYVGRVRDISRPTAYCWWTKLPEVR